MYQIGVSYFTADNVDDTRLCEECGQAGTKEAKTGWLQTMTAIAYKLTKPSYGVSSKEFELIKSIYEWLSE